MTAANFRADGSHGCEDDFITSVTERTPRSQPVRLTLRHFDVLCDSGLIYTFNLSLGLTGTEVLHIITFAYNLKTRIFADYIFNLMFG